MERRRYLKLMSAGSIAAFAGCAGSDGSGNGSDGGSDGSDGNDGSDGDGSDGGGGNGGTQSPVTIAAIEPQSGPFSPWATVHLEGLQIAIDELNAGDTLDREIRLVTTDTGADAGDADSAFRRHVEQDGAVAVTGPVSSDVGIRTARTAQELEVPNFLHMAGAQEILSADTRYTFRTGWLPSSSHARADADFFAKNDVSSVGVIIADYAWGRSVESALEEFTPDAIDLHIKAAPVTTSDFKSFLRQMPDGVELMDFVGHPPGAITATLQMFELGMDQTVLGVDPPQLAIINALGSNVTNDVITRHLAVPGTDGFNSLGKKVAQRFDKPMYAYQSIGYMTAKMIGEAVSEVGADPTGIADYARNNSFDMLYANPLEYTEWGEFKDPILQYSRFVEGAPSYYSDAEFKLEVVTKSDPLPAPEPGS